MMAHRLGTVFLVLVVLLYATGAPAFAQTPVSTSVGESEDVEPSPTTATEEGADETTEEDETGSAEESGISGIVASVQPPEPAMTPGVVSDVVADFAGQTGLAELSLLGLSAEDWINLAISLLIILAGYLFGTWVIRRLLPRIVRRTPTEFDDKLLAALGAEVRWLVVIFFLRFAIVRLVFLRIELKTILQSVLYIVAFVIVLRIIWQSINVAEEWFNQLASEAEREDELVPVIKLLVILGRVFAFVIGISVLLSYFGFDVIIVAASLGVGGLAISLAAKDTITDTIAGITILIDRPFRIGDRIEVQEINTWGDVVNIGLRTTRVRARDNRMVIVPNSSIAKNEVVNYTFPDPRYRIQTHVGIAYGTDIETARQLIVNTVRQIEEVLENKPVDALYNEMGDSAMIFRVRWWIESYADKRRVLDRVHTGIQTALDANDIEMPFPTASRTIQLEPETIGELSDAIWSANENRNN